MIHARSRDPWLRCYVGGPEPLIVQRTHVLNVLASSLMGGNDRSSSRPKPSASGSHSLYRATRRSRLLSRSTSSKRNTVAFTPSHNGTHRDDDLASWTERRSKACFPTTASRAPQPTLERRHLLRPAALLTLQNDLQWIQHRDPATTPTIHPKRIAMPRIVGDAVETLGAHGFRRTDQTRAAQAVMMHAIAASIDGLRTIMGTSDSIASHVPHLF